jgi:hypothetical protein
MERGSRRVLQGRLYDHESATGTSPDYLRRRAIERRNLESEAMAVTRSSRLRPELSRTAHLSIGWWQGRVYRNDLNTGASAPLLLLCKSVSAGSGPMSG